MAGESAPSAPQNTPTADAALDNPASTAAGQGDAQNSQPASDQPKTRGKKNPTSPEKTARPKRSVSAVIADADELRAAELESRVDACESELAHLKKQLTTKRPPVADDVTKRLLAVDNKIKELTATTVNLDKADHAFDKHFTSADRRQDELDASIVDVKATIADLVARADAAETRIADIKMALDATNEELARTQDDLARVISTSSDDWEAFDSFRRDAEQRMQDQEDALAELRARGPPAPSAAPADLERRSTASRRRPLRLGNDDDDQDTMRAAAKRIRRDSSGRASPAPPSDAPRGEPDVYGDGGVGDNSWITCRIGQPSRPDGTTIVTWKDDAYNLKFLALLCENLARENGGCPTPVKSFLPADDSNNKVWRYFQFSNRENFVRFMSFWNKRDDLYRSLRAIPVAHSVNVASIADLLRKSQRPQQDRESDRRGRRP